jgi:hypothetical protein
MANPFERALWTGMLSLSACGSGAEREEIATLGEGLSGITIVARVRDSALVGLAGTRVQLNGAIQRSAVTDANGIAVFTGLSSGSYSLDVSRYGATYQSSVANLNGVSADVVHDFTCISGCLSGPTGVSVDRFKELVIVNPSVTADARASNTSNGHLSFRYLMEQMSPPGTPPEDFVETWLQGFTVTAINGDQLGARSPANLRDFWPKNADGKVDLGQAPFRLLGIFNRTDLHATGSGELRFVYGLNLSPVQVNRMTVIFEYGLPNNAAFTSRSSWVSRFHELSAFAAFDEPYKAKLQELTDLVVSAGATRAHLGNPTGSALAQLRTSEDRLSSATPFWAFREFKLASEPGNLHFLRPAPVAQTPDDADNGDAALEAFIDTNRTGFLAGVAALPAADLGGEALVNFQVTSQFRWQFPNVDEPLRHAFAGQTCNGCHFHDVLPHAPSRSLFYHVSPFEDGGVDGTTVLSSFLIDVELPRRISFLQNQLDCADGSVACASGAEPVVP